MKISNDFIQDAKRAESPEELRVLLEKNGVDITANEVSAYFNKLNPKKGEMEDDELDSVSGGGCSKKSTFNPFSRDSGWLEGDQVYLINEGHCSGGASDYKPSRYCSNRNCSRNSYKIVKRIDDTMYLIECMGCGWTYRAEKRNIKGKYI